MSPRAHTAPVTKAIASIALVACLGPVHSMAQLPGGISVPGGISLPTTGFSKDALLAKAKELVADLLSMKDSGKLAPDQVKQVDDLLPKAQSLTGELDKPQVDAARLPQLATDLSDLQRQVASLKSLIR